MVPKGVKQAQIKPSHARIQYMRIFKIFTTIILIIIIIKQPSGQPSGAKQSWSEPSIKH